MSRYKITVKTFNNDVLTFNVDEYTISKGFVEFIDLKYNIIKKFPVSNCEIEEVSKDKFQEKEGGVE